MLGFYQQKEGSKFVTIIGTLNKKNLLHFKQYELKYKTCTK